MSPILQYGLPHMGICRNFPWSIVFATHKYFGLGFQHLYTIQEILRLKDMIQNNFRKTMRGDLYQASLELLYTELGVTNDLHNIPFEKMAPLATDSLVKSTWYFLYTNGLCLHHDLKIQAQ
jgi:hypothetical protein